VSRRPSQIHHHHHNDVATLAASVRPYPASADGGTAGDSGAIGGVNISANAADKRSLGNASVTMATAGARGNNINVNSSQQFQYHHHRQQQQQQQLGQSQREREAMRQKLAEWYQLHPHLSPVTPVRLPRSQNNLPSKRR